MSPTGAGVARDETALAEQQTPVRQHACARFDRRGDARRAEAPREGIRRTIGPPTSGTRTTRPSASAAPLQAVSRFTGALAGMGSRSVSDPLRASNTRTPSMPKSITRTRSSSRASRDEMSSESWSAGRALNAPVLGSKTCPVNLLCASVESPRSRARPSRRGGPPAPRRPENRRRRSIRRASGRTPLRTASLTSVRPHRRR